MILPLQSIFASKAHILILNSSRVSCMVLLLILASALSKVKTCDFREENYYVVIYNARDIL
jgi:hypothetical protein